MQTKQGTLAVLALVSLVLAATVSLAQASEVTRESFTAQVEPICKANTEANEKILKGVKAEVQSGKLAPAAVQFAKAAAALKHAYAQLAAVAKPPADTAKLTKWLSYVKAEAALFQATAAKLKSGDKLGAEKMVVLLTHTADLANDAALGFEFHYCRFEPSRFT
jgi:hypothetical protein